MNAFNEESPLQFVQEFKSQSVFPARLGEYFYFDTIASQLMVRAGQMEVRRGSAEK